MSKWGRPGGGDNPAMWVGSGGLHLVSCNAASRGWPGSAMLDGATWQMCWLPGYYLKGL